VIVTAPPARDLGRAARDSEPEPPEQAQRIGARIV
jgi:hypothetical protein